MPTINPQFEGWTWRDTYQLLCPRCAVPSQNGDIPLYSRLSVGMAEWGLVYCHNVECLAHSADLHTVEAMKAMVYGALLGRQGEVLPE